MHTANERRRSPRVAADLDLRLELSGKSGLAHVRDISASGVRCHTSQAIPLMTEVGLVILLPSGSGRREIVCRGAVVRSGPVAKPGTRGLSYETAIFFTEMQDEDRVRVGEFVSAGGHA
jgi:hypothetical protein